MPHLLGEIISAKDGRMEVFFVCYLGQRYGRVPKLWERQKAEG